MGKGLREFLVSYVVSHLTDSMTSSLNLTPTSNPLPSTAASLPHSRSESMKMDAEDQVDGDDEEGDSSSHFTDPDL